MNNSYCRKYILGFCDQIKMDDTLSHHGVMGMRWGHRNGPPYPLDGVDKKFAKAEYKRKKEQDRRVERLQKARKKAAKLKVKAAKKERKHIEEEERILRIKEKLLKRDNYKEIMKNAKYFTNEELEYLKERHEKQISDKMDRFINKAAKVTTAVNTIMNMSTGLKQLESLKQTIEANDLAIASSKLDIEKKATDLAKQQKEFEYFKADRGLERSKLVAQTLNENMKAYAQRSAAAISDAKAMAEYANTMAKLMDYEATRNVRLQDIPGPTWFNTRPQGWNPQGYTNWNTTTINPFGSGGGKK